MSETTRQPGTIERERDALASRLTDMTKLAGELARLLKLSSNYLDTAQNLSWCDWEAWLQTVKQADDLLVRARAAGLLEPSP